MDCRYGCCVGTASIRYRLPLEPVPIFSSKVLMYFSWTSTSCLANPNLQGLRTPDFRPKALIKST